MSIIFAMVLALALVVATVAIHYEVLRATSRVSRPMTTPRSRMLVVLGGVLIAHAFEVLLYAAVYFLMHSQFRLGSIGGEFQGDLLDFFYFSISCFTTLGIGDVFPQGPLRIVAGVEALNGFVLIGWSASFTYLAMQDHS